MTIKSFGDRLSFEMLFEDLQEALLIEPSFTVGEWQSQKVDMPMRELRNVNFAWPLPATAEELAEATGAHLPWAEDHFLERVGGQPLNPSPSEAWWPFASKKGGTNTAHKSEGEAFSHTYPERMWPKLANGGGETQVGGVNEPHRGIRFEFGDLQDVVNQLSATPFTRQAYLPLWFPEDTGAVHGKRVPCTLGYHFAIRDGKLDITYFMRSTDLLRHFQDDIYLAGRLAQWVVDGILKQTAVVGYNFADPQPDPLVVGEIIFHTANLHIFEGDVPVIEYRRSQGNNSWAK